MPERIRAASDYRKIKLHPVKSVLLEVLSLIGKYRNDVVLIGGLSPSLLIDEIKSISPPHVGTKDVDLLLNISKISQTDYATISQKLLNRGYRYRKDSEGNDLKFIFEKEIEGVTVEVDFLGPEYAGKKSKERVTVQNGLQVRKVHGADLVFPGPFKDVVIRVLLPDGISHEETVHVIPGGLFIILKAFAFDDRKEEKDAYDIHYVLKNYPGGMGELVQEVLPLREHGLVQEALHLLEQHFGAKDRIGPARLRAFLIDEIEDKALLMTEITILVKEFVYQLKK